MKFLSIFSAVLISVSAQTIPRGTTIAVRTIDSIDSKTADPGKTFSASLDEPLTVNGNVIATRGAKAILKVTEVKSAGKIKGKAELMVSLASIESGSETISVETESVTSESGGKGGATTKKAAVGGAIGAIAGGIFGGGKGAAIGAATGAGAGAAVSMATKGPTVKIPSETKLTFITH